VIPAHAAQDGPTPYPAPTDEGAWAGVGPIRVFGWMVDNRKWFWTQREKEQGSVVFVGDSLTGNWKIDDMKKAFLKLKIANCGIGGDVSRGVLFRFKEDVLDLKPTAIVLCIGTNDLSAKAKPELVEQNIVAILAQARAYSATMPIVLCQIPPRDSASAPTDPGAVADLNARIAKIGASEKNLAVLDLFAAMSTPDGKPVPEYFTKDKLHPAPAGYEKWAQVMQPVFDKLGVK
jgi:lysophospholipase L1-like esterase